MRLPDIRAVVFDMDGTLVDTEPLYMDGWLAVLPEYGVQVDEAIYHAHIPGRPGREVCEQHFGLSPEQSVAVVEQIMVRFWEQAGHVLAPVDGLLDLLNQLAPFPMAIATSNRRVDALRILAALRVSERFAVLVAADDVQRGKPDPEPFVRAAQALGVAPLACLAFEDSPNGVASAMAAGMYCVGIGPAAGAAHLHVQSLTDERITGLATLLVNRR